MLVLLAGYRVAEGHDVVGSDVAHEAEVADVRLRQKSAVIAGEIDILTVLEDVTLPRKCLDATFTGLASLPDAASAGEADVSVLVIEVGDDVDVVIVGAIDVSKVEGVRAVLVKELKDVACTKTVSTIVVVVVAIIMITITQSERTLKRRCHLDEDGRL